MDYCTDTIRCNIEKCINNRKNWESIPILKAIIQRNALHKMNIYTEIISKIELLDYYFDTSIDVKFSVIYKDGSWNIHILNHSYIDSLESV